MTCEHKEKLFHQWFTLPRSGTIPIMKCVDCGRFEFVGADDKDFPYIGNHELIINLEVKE